MQGKNNDDEDDDYEDDEDDFDIEDKGSQGMEVNEKKLKMSLESD